MKEMTIDQLVLSMFNAISAPLNEEEYKIFNISKLNILKRRKFANIYKTLLLYLVKLSIPMAFPRYSSEIMKLFDGFLKKAYENNQTTKKAIEKDLNEFNKLTEEGGKDKFLKLALYITEMFEKKPIKAVYAAKLNVRMENLYTNFLAIGFQVKIRNSETE